MPSPVPSVYTTPLTPDQAARLHELLKREGFRFEPRPHTICFAQKDRVSVAVYEKGPKAVVQGRGLQEFVEFLLEPEILGEARLGYEEVHNPEMFEPHFGIDESGKGDFFGPLVIAGVFVDRDIARALRDAGVTDSKRIGSDKRIRDLAAIIRKSRAPQAVVVISPERYNALLEKMGNLNSLLAWGHAKTIELLCEQRPDCPRALSDKFAHASVLKRALGPLGREIALDQRTKAESDPAVAAASILAREAFIDWLDRASAKRGVRLGRGVNEAVKAAARRIVAEGGREALAACAKMHFKTAAEVLS